VGSASLSAVTWTVTSTRMSARGVREASTNELLHAAPAVQAQSRPGPAPLPQQRQPAPWRAPRMPVEPAPPPRWATSMLSAMGPEAHQAEVLWSRAEKLAEETHAITLARATVAPQALKGIFDSAHVAYQRGGIRIVQSSERSLEGLLGLQKGDLVTALNGHALDRPEGALEAYADLVAGRAAVIELVRGGKLVALRIDRAS